MSEEKIRDLVRRIEELEEWDKKLKNVILYGGFVLYLFLWIGLGLFIAINEKTMDEFNRLLFMPLFIIIGIAFFWFTVRTRN